MTQTSPWWQRGTIYQVYPRSFKDSNADGVGDLHALARAERLSGGRRLLGCGSRLGCCLQQGESVGGFGGVSEAIPGEGKGKESGDGACVTKCLLHGRPPRRAAMCLLPGETNAARFVKDAVEGINLLLR